MATLSIDHVLAEMSKTGKSSSSRTATSRPDPNLEPGKVVATSPNTTVLPPFSRYTADPSPFNNMPQKYTARRHLTSGPIPAPGTPQDRFAAVLGHSNGRIGPPPPPPPVMGMDMHMGALYPSPSGIPAPTANMHTNGPRSGYCAPQPAIQPFSALPFPSARGPSTGPAANTCVVGNGSNGSNGAGGRGPALPDPWATATQWLSFECQKRHFNPAFKVKESRTRTGDVRYQCTVTLKDIVVLSNTQFDSAQAAKAHVAEKALKQVRREWPMTDSARRANNAGAGDTVLRQEELRQQLIQSRQNRNIETPQPAPMPPSTVDMGDPVQARAFVEGFRMGQLAAQRAAAGPGSSPPSIKEPLTRPLTRSRSLSPHRSSSHGNGCRRHRQRSPLRGSSRAKGEEDSPPRYYDGSRHDPRLPSTDRYRPCHPGLDDKHGRLRDFDDEHQDS